MTTTELLDLLPTLEWCRIEDLPDSVELLELLNDPTVDPVLTDRTLAAEYAEGDGLVLVADGRINVDPHSEFPESFILAPGGTLLPTCCVCHTREATDTFQGGMVCPECFTECTTRAAAQAERDAGWDPNP